jgi:hypothetical protein
MSVWSLEFGVWSLEFGVWMLLDKQLHKRLDKRLSTAGYPNAYPNLEFGEACSNPLSKIWISVCGAPIHYPNCSIIHYPKFG